MILQKGATSYLTARKLSKAKKCFLDEGIKSDLGEGIFGFLEENLVKDPDGRISKTDLYEKFKKGSSKHHSSTKFWIDFKKWADYRNIPTREIQNGERFKTGVAFKNSIDEDDAKPGLDIF